MLDMVDLRQINVSTFGINEINNKMSGVTYS